MSVYSVEKGIESEDDDGFIKAPDVGDIILSSDEGGESDVEFGDQTTVIIILCIFHCRNYFNYFMPEFFKIIC